MELGLLQPVVAVPASGGPYRLVEGRRRCKAIALLSEAGQWPSPPHVEALVIEASEAARVEVRGGLTLVLHATRSSSPASELAALEAILETDRGSEEAATIKEIAAQTGISVQTVRRRLRLRSLSAGLRRAFDEGKLTANVAEASARLPSAQQERLERQLENGVRLTLAEVRDVAREQASAATDDLPNGLFADHDVGWQATVRGHLVAALSAIPGGEQHAQLKRVLTDALARAERL